MKQIFVFGHSVTQGFWDKEGGWVQRLRKTLDERSLENPDEYYFETYNLGVSGDDSNQLLDRFEDEIKARISNNFETIILIQIGANDIQYLEKKGMIRVEKQEFKRNLTELINKSRNYSNKIAIIGESYTTIEGPIPWSKDRHLSDQRLKEYVEIQRKVSETEDIPYVDMRNLVSKEKWKKNLKDGSHPNSKGHKLIYQNVKELLIEEGYLSL